MRGFTSSLIRSRLQVVLGNCYIERKPSAHDCGGPTSHRMLVDKSGLCPANAMSQNDLDAALGLRMQFVSRQE